MEEFKLIFDNPDKLKAMLNYNTIHVFFDGSVSNNFKNYIVRLLNGKKVIQSVVTNIADEQWITSLSPKNEDFVIAVGGIQLQNIVKYYSYMHYLKYAVIPCGQIAEYSLSSRAFVKDKYFQFYACEKPQFCFIFSTLFSKEQIFNLYKVLSYKNIVKFESEVAGIVFNSSANQSLTFLDKINLCQITLEQIIKLYAMISIGLEADKTYNFLGIDYMLLSFMAGNDPVEELIGCQNFLVKFYTCMLKFNFLRASVDTNLHLKKIHNLLGISYLDASKKALNIFTSQNLSDAIIKLKAYKPHLEMFLEVCKTPFVFSKIDLSDKKYQIAITFASNLFPFKNILRLAKEMGYFENLIKDL